MLRCTRIPLMLQHLEGQTTIKKYKLAEVSKTKVEHDDAEKLFINLTLLNYYIFHMTAI